VLVASLVLSSLAVAVTVTYARHAILAKKTLELAKGASQVEEASRSGMDRMRERMRAGDLPGTVADGTHDFAVTPTGEEVEGEREHQGGKRREVRVRATGQGANGDSEQVRVKARMDVTPGNGATGDRTGLECDEGSSLLLAGNLVVVSGNQSYVGTELSGLILLEEGSELTLEDVVLRGTIITRHGACKSNPRATGANRPRVNVYGGLRLLAGTEMPDVAMSTPDAVFVADESSRVEMRGFVSADELLVRGKARVEGVCVSGEAHEFSPKTRRPGHGRGAQDYPEAVRPGAEEITRVEFPNDLPPYETLDLMAYCDLGLEED